MKTGLTDDEMARIRAALEAVPAVEKAVLFGSRAMGLARSNSDVDILLYGGALQTRDVLRLASLLDATTLPYQFDLIRHDVNNAALLEHVKNYGKVIFQRQKTASQSKPIGKKPAMASEWNKTTIGAQATLQRGVDITKTEQREGAVPVVSSSGISSYHDTACAKGPGVILGRKGVVGSVHYVVSDYWPHDTSLWVKDFHGNEVRFVYYFFKWMTPRIATLDVGSANPTLNRNHVHPIEIIWPPKSEQRAIAHILGTLDDKIELNRRINETLEAMARALFKAWFVDFEPVRAKLEGRWRRGQSLPGLPAHLYDLFPDRLVESEFGEIPESWNIASVGEEFDVTMGQSPPGNTYNETGSGLPFYQGCTDFQFRFPKRRVYCTAPTRLAKLHDTLISVRAPVGEINMASENCAIGRGVAAIRHKTGIRSYTYQFFDSIADVFSKFNNEGTVFGSINKKDFTAIKFVNPAKEVILTYERLIQPLNDSIENNQYESTTLTQLRDTLLPKLISGELRIQDAKRIVGAS